MNAKTGSIKKFSFYRNYYGGSTLIVVVVLSVITSVVMSSFLFTTKTTQKLGGQQTAKVASLNITEAGKENALAMLRSGVSTIPKGSKTTLIQTTSFGAGSYAVTCSTNTSEDTAWLWSTGTKASQTKRIETKFTVSSSPTDPVWEHALFANQNLNIHGNGTLIGKSHSNGMVIVHGNLEFQINPAPSCTITAVTLVSVNGNVKVKGLLKSPHVYINGNNEAGISRIETSVTNLPCPNLDFSRFRDTAVANSWVRAGQEYSGDQIWNNVNGGVIWFDGHVTFKGNLTYKGILIATGNIYVNGNLNQSLTSDKKGGMVSTGGEIIIYGNQNFKGLVYATNNVIFKGNQSIEGQVIACGELDLEGNFGNVTYVLSDHGFAGGTRTYSEISWRELPEN